MSCNLESSEGWDRTFLDLSSKMSEPFCAAWNLCCFRLVAPLDPQKFENCTTQAKEIATRTLIGLGLSLGGFLLCTVPVPMLSSVAVMGVGSKVFRAIGFALQKEGYTHVRGTGPEKALDPQDPQVKVVSWNLCGVGGGMSLNHGGVVHWRSRLDAILEKIKTEDPDVLVLQEIYDTALAEALIERLQSDYAHFFTHLGPNVWGSVGGCMVISKCAVHDFSNTSFSNNPWTVNRGFATLELKATPQDVLPCARIIGTHFIDGKGVEDKTNRIVQVAQIVNSVAHKTLAIPTLLAGDLNMERDQEEGTFLSSYLHHGYQGAEPTCTNRLVAQWDYKEPSVSGETIDYLSLFKSVLPDGKRIPTLDENIVLEHCHLLEAYDRSYNTKTALSDHHGLSILLRGHLHAQAGKEGDLP